MAELGIGIVGLGMGRSLLGINIMADFPANVRGVCDLVEAATDAARQEFGVEYATDKIDALLERDDIDVVGIYTPDHLHRDQVIQALEAGKHVLVTKPMSISNQESEDIISAVRRTGKRVMPAQTQRFTQNHLAIRRLIDPGEFGDIYFIAADYYQDLRPVYDHTPWRYEVPQDFIYGGLSHNIDIMRFLKGEIVEIGGYGSNSGLDPRYPADTFETFVLNARFEDGTIGRIAMAPAVRPPLANVYVQVFGTQGTFVPNQVVLDNFEGKPSLELDFVPEAWAFAEVRVLRNFVDSILADEPQAVNEIDGARITAVGDAITASVNSDGSPQEVRLDF